MHTPFFTYIYLKKSWNIWAKFYKSRIRILQARLQQYVNRELPDVQAGFRKGRGTRD